MENNSLFPLKYRLRKTDELVEVVAWETADKGARNENDWVSYIDAEGNEHIKEHLTLEWDFVIDSPFEKVLSGGFGSGLDKFDPWEARRYELVKDMIFSDRDFGVINIEKYVNAADKIIAKLKESQELAEKECEFENIGIGEIIKTVSDDGTEIFRKFIFTDCKDIVGYEGDSGRWAVGDRVKVYIKRLEPQEEERPVP